MSNCEYHYQNMQYERARVSSKNSPCTNVPLNCPICPTTSTGQKETFWKYEFIIHMIERHLTESNELPILPLELLVTTHISKAEEMEMGIPQIKTEKWRDDHQILDSDDIHFIVEEDADDGEAYDEAEYGNGDSGGDATEDERLSRKRAMSAVSTASRQGSPTKKHQTTRA